MKKARNYPSCFYDDQSNSVFVTGGRGSRGQGLATSEKLNLDTYQWESIPSLPQPLYLSDGVASKSIEYIGFVAGGYTDTTTNKVLGLRRRDLMWEVMPKQLQKARRSYSMVNVASDEVPGCQSNLNIK